MNPNIEFNLFHLFPFASLGMVGLITEVVEEGLAVEVSVVLHRALASATLVEEAGILVLVDEITEEEEVAGK